MPKKFVHTTSTLLKAFNQFIGSVNKSHGLKGKYVPIDPQSTKAMTYSAYNWALYIRELLFKIKGKDGLLGIVLAIKPALQHRQKDAEYEEARLYLGLDRKNVKDNMVIQGMKKKLESSVNYKKFDKKYKDLQKIKRDQVKEGEKKQALQEKENKLPNEKQASQKFRNAMVQIKNKKQNLSKKYSAISGDKRTYKKERDAYFKMRHLNVIIKYNKSDSYSTEKARLQHLDAATDFLSSDGFVNTLTINQNEFNSDDIEAFTKLIAMLEPLIADKNLFQDIPEIKIPLFLKWLPPLFDTTSKEIEDGVNFYIKLIKTKVSMVFKYLDQIAKHLASADQLVKFEARNFKDVLVKRMDDSVNSVEKEIADFNVRDNDADNKVNLLGAKLKFVIGRISIKLKQAEKLLKGKLEQKLKQSKNEMPVENVGKLENVIKVEIYEDDQEWKDFSLVRGYSQKAVENVCENTNEVFMQEHNDRLTKLKELRGHIEKLKEIIKIVKAIPNITPILSDDAEKNIEAYSKAMDDIKSLVSNVSQYKNIKVLEPAIATLDKAAKEITDKFSSEIGKIKAEQERKEKENALKNEKGLQQVIEKAEVNLKQKRIELSKVSELIKKDNKAHATRDIYIIRVASKIDFKGSRSGILQAHTKYIESVVVQNIENSKVIDKLKRDMRKNKGIITDLENAKGFIARKKDRMKIPYESLDKVKGKYKDKGERNLILKVISVIFKGDNDVDKILERMRDVTLTVSWTDAGKAMKRDLVEFKKKLDEKISELREKVYLAAKKIKGLEENKKNNQDQMSVLGEENKKLEKYLKEETELSKNKKKEAVQKLDVERLKVLNKKLSDFHEKKARAAHKPGHEKVMEELVENAMKQQKHKQHLVAIKTFSKSALKGAQTIEKNALSAQAQQHQHQHQNANEQRIPMNSLPIINGQSKSVPTKPGFFNRLFVGGLISGVIGLIVGMVSMVLLSFTGIAALLPVVILMVVGGAMLVGGVVTAAVAGTDAYQNRKVSDDIERGVAAAINSTAPAHDEINGERVVDPALPKIHGSVIGQPVNDSKTGVQIGSLDHDEGHSMDKGDDAPDLNQHSKDE